MSSSVVSIRGSVKSLEEALDTFGDIHNYDHARFNKHSSQVVLSEHVSDNDPPCVACVSLGAFVEYDFPELFMPSFNHVCTGSLMLCPKPVHLEQPLVVFMFFNGNEMDHWKRQTSAVMDFAYHEPTYVTSNYRFVSVLKQSSKSLMSRLIVRESSLKTRTRMYDAIDEQRTKALLGDM